MNRSSSHPLKLLIGAVLILCGNLPIEALAVDYEQQIKPILKARCYACHGALKQQAALRLDTGALLRAGGDTGSAVEIATPDDSLLLDRLRSDDEEYRMPPIGEPLTSAEIELIRGWIAGGAKSPMSEAPEADPSEHWAFQPLQRPQLPTNPQADAVHPIDGFLAARYRQSGLQPAGPAEPARRLRRLFLDLTGLPPTRTELRDFLAEPSAEHFAHVADRLLESPTYGERWGRHWMDVWRYSDWYGRRQVNDVRNSAPQIWRWRDWIINSLNRDKGYDRMIQEMLAADELAADDDTAWPATGYLVRNYYSLNPNEWMRHNVEYTGKAFLGLTFNCAHCHDHKYDPIEHEDYFRLRAFFEPMGIRQDRVQGEPEPPVFEVYKYGGSRKAVQLGMVRIYDKNPKATTWFYSGGDERNRDAERGGIQPGVPRFLNVPLPTLKSIELPLAAWYPGARTEIQNSELRDREAAVVSAREKLRQAQTTNVDTTAARAKLETAKASLDRALAKARENGKSAALAGKQSLLIEALQGRQIVQNALPNLKTLPEGSTFSFQLQLLRDNHFNFQLARDTSKGLTALYLGFVKGRIKAYRPGGFQEFEVGSYDFAAGQNRFEVRMVLQPQQDRVLVTIRQPKSDQPLVSETAIALNAWNPTKHPNQPFTLDCRTGTQVLLDEIRFTAGEQKFYWGFESPRFSDGADVAGIEGWRVHPESKAPARSSVTMTGANPDVQAGYQAWKDAESDLQALTLGADAAKQNVVAAEQRLKSLQDTLAADRALRDALDPMQREALAKRAHRSQKTADLNDAAWREMDARLQLATARGLPDSDKSKAQKVKAVAAKHAAAAKQLNQARQAAANLDALGPDYKKLSPVSSKTSTGRRAALALWITDRRNPLTPRVAVNHIWMRHFGTPLVESVYDFGRNGKHPSHPKLLDWLAVELVENNWSMKHLHRLIVTSQAYGMDSDSAREENWRIDEDNKLLWRRNRLRMEAELVRDSVLYISGQLNSELGGRSLPTTSAESTFRRSLYYEVYPEAGGVIEMSRLFDAADPVECYRRASTIMPQQALALSNSKLIHQASAAVATKISDSEDVKTDAEFVQAAFETILSRPPATRETQACERFLLKQRKLVSDENMVRTSLIRVLFNHNDFVTIR